MTAPDVEVFLDDGSGTYLLDVSDLVELQEGITISGYGRGDEFAQAQSAQLQLVLDNSDGDLSVGTGWDTGGWDEDRWGGAGLLYVGQGIRIRVTEGATTRDRFTGRLTGGDLNWQGGSAGYAMVQISAMDPLTDLAGITLRSMLEQEILARSPSSYYTLGEAAPSTSAGDTSGNQAAPLGSAGSGAPVEFGSGTGPGVDGLTAATFAGGQYLSGAVPTLGPSWSVAFFFATAAVPTGFGMPLMDLGVIAPLIDSSGVMLGRTVNDGSTHMMVLSNSGSALNIYIDGTLVSSGAPLSVPTSFKVGAGAGLPAVYNGTMSHIEVYPTALSSGDVAAIYSASIGVTETTAARFARIAAYGGFTTSTTAGVSGQLMGAQATSGQSLFDALQTVAAAEGGVLYADGSGTIVLQGRGYRAGRLSPDLTLTSDEAGADTSATLDNQQKVTQVTVNRIGGATQVVGAHTPGVEDKSLDLVVDRDSDALQAAQWIVAKHSDPGPRIGSAILNPYNSPNAEQILQLDLGQRLLLDDLPTQAWDNTGDVTIEGWTETITEAAWTVDVNLLPWSLATALVLDDPDFGELDTFPLMN